MEKSVTKSTTPNIVRKNPLFFLAEFYRHKFLPKSKKGNQFLQNFGDAYVKKSKRS